MDSLYINRELSLLEFHKRVLAQAFDPELPLLLSRVHPVHELVRIDYFVPGCPPSAQSILYVIGELLEGRVPDLGSRQRFG